MKNILVWLGLALLLAPPVYGEMPDPLAPAKDLTPVGFGDARQPQVAVSPMGIIYVVFGKDTSVYLTSSTDRGVTFSTPIKVCDDPGLMLGMRRGPRIAASEKRLVVTVPGKELVSYYSDDGGKTWTATQPINDQPGSAAEGLQNITALPDGSFYAVWLDARAGNQGAQVEGARLDAGAMAWGKNVTVYASPERTVCQCCHPSVVTTAKGDLVVMFRNALAGFRDLYIVRSSDRGETFSGAIKCGDGTWKLDACPMDGGGLITFTGGPHPEALYTAWRRNNEVFLYHLGEKEAKMGEGRQPVLAWIRNTIWLAWQDRQKLVVHRLSPDGQPDSLFVGGYPSLVASPDGKEGYLAWENTEGKEAKVQFVVLK